MPTTVFFYKDGSGTPVHDWLLGLGDPAGQARLIVRIDELVEFDFRLSEPASKPIGNGLRELRAKNGKIQYRILYFFFRDAAILLHGCRKEAKLDREDIRRALKRKEIVESNFSARTECYEQE